MSQQRAQSELLDLLPLSEDVILDEFKALRREVLMKFAKESFNSKKQDDLITLKDQLSQQKQRILLKNKKIF